MPINILFWSRQKTRSAGEIIGDIRI